MIIVHFTPTYHPVIGGIESVVKSLATQMASLNHRVYVICLSRHTLVSDSAREITADGVSVLYFTHYDIFSPSRISRLSKVLRSADILHLHDPKLGLLVAIALTLLPKTKKYLTTHGGFYHHNRFPLIKKLYASTWARYALGKLNTVFAISEADFLAFSRLSPVPNVRLSLNVVRMNPFGVDPAVHPPGVRNWLYWGRTSSNKNLVSLLNFLMFLNNNDVHIVLHVCSSYPLQDLIAFAKQHGLTNVFFYHKPDNSHIASLINQSSVFVLPSSYEGFGLTLVEAASSGLLPIFNDISPLNTVFPSDVGLALDFSDFRSSLVAFLEYEMIVSSDQSTFVTDAIAASQVYSPKRRVEEILSVYLS
ncbi:glycosyltransferase family 4 protein [Synechococcus sp. CCY9202]|uniref:glycosyltransferase family 4 protein n=1 Tax=Synechococcus sp. CCY9202 TaxID=174698 RepID=UPI002B20CBA4|nr:glycosyltransferase family 4 protein [Synechococcus sp. CCY9202]MEA5423638.1 glycosyltransferase family 4 protein [Synechococcus sp. CCY9202]